MDHFEYKLVFGNRTSICLPLVTRDRLISHVTYAYWAPYTCYSRRRVSLWA